jgi:phosphate starvation-inducible protein PhoH and related proteins
LSKVALLKVKLKEGIDTASLFGSRDVHLKMIEEAFGIRVSARGEEVLLEGPPEAVRGGERLLGGLTTMMGEGLVLRPDDVEFAIRTFKGGGDSAAPQETGRGAVEVSTAKRMIHPKSPTQKRYLEAIRAHDLVLGIGPAGTGKTYLAMAMAVTALKNREVGRIILTRPAVEAGEKLGYLPGTLSEKVDPYLRPLYDALFDMMEPDKSAALIERGVIEVAPLAYMRGRTLNDSFIILDEAQNTSPEQMKMFLTRLGFGSRVVVTGDITQIDIPTGTSGLRQVRDILKGVEDLCFIELGSKDVVRHKLVQRIVNAYHTWEEARSAAHDA